MACRPEAAYSYASNLILSGSQRAPQVTVLVTDRRRGVVRPGGHARLSRQQRAWGAVARGRWAVGWRRGGRARALGEVWIPDREAPAGASTLGKADDSRIERRFGGNSGPCF